MKDEGILLPNSSPKLVQTPSMSRLQTVQPALCPGPFLCRAEPSRDSLGLWGHPEQGGQFCAPTETCVLQVGAGCWSLALLKPLTNQESLLRGFFYLWFKSLSPLTWVSWRPILQCLRIINNGPKPETMGAQQLKQAVIHCSPSTCACWSTAGKDGRMSLEFLPLPSRLQPHQRAIN